MYVIHIKFITGTSIEDAYMFDSTLVCGNTVKRNDICTLQKLNTPKNIVIDI